MTLTLEEGTVSFVDQYTTTMGIGRFRRTKAEKEAGLSPEEAARIRLEPTEETPKED